MRLIRRRLDFPFLSTEVCCIPISQEHIDIHRRRLNIIEGLCVADFVLLGKLSRFIHPTFTCQFQSDLSPLLGMTNYDLVKLDAGRGTESVTGKSLT